MIIKLACDFETTVTGDADQNETEVWRYGLVDIQADNNYDEVKTGGSIDDFFKTLFAFKFKTIAYFHNEKFDGSFIIDWLLKNGYKPALRKDEQGNEYMASAQKDLKNKEFTCMISEKGIWYTIKIKHANKIYEIRDSYKLLPFSLRKIGKDFKTEHQKTEIEYTGNRYANCPVTEQEEEYMKNDVLVLKEALNIMEDEGHTKMTIGSCCMSEYKSKFHPLYVKQQYPNLYTEDYDLPDGYGAKTAGDYIRNSYKGGWCYLKPDRANILFEANLDFNGKKIAGTTCDVNSLYPSMMHSDSGNKYPVGNPHFFKGDVPSYLDKDDIYYFIRVRTRFYLKEGKLPTIQIKHSPLYHPREWLTSSDYIDKDGNAWRYLTDDITGEPIQMIPTLTFTQTDWEMVKECYDLEDTEILDGCWFYCQIGIFDEYINKYAEIKMKSKGAKRQIAKLFLNNLYGKFATSTDASYKVPYLAEDGVVHFYNQSDTCIEKAGYIPIGSAITAYSRAFTQTAAIANYDVFTYSDTDSIHLLCTPDEVKGAPEDPVKFNHWKYEACWEKAIFVRAKTYIEYVNFEDREEVIPYFNVRCAGMPDRAKSNFICKMTHSPLKKGATEDEIKDYEDEVGIHNLTPEEIAFHKTEAMTMKDFKVGLSVPGSLKPKRIKGGIVLFNGLYVMRPHII